MLQVIGTIPNLVGTTCEALFCQQYWYQGELTEQVNVLFLKVSNHIWQRFFFDYGVLFWKQVDSLDVWYTTIADEYHYPQIDLGNRYNLVGKVIEELKVIDRELNLALSIQFLSHTTLLLTDEGDQMTLSVV